MSFPDAPNFGLPVDESARYKTALHGITYLFEQARLCVDPMVRVRFEQIVNSQEVAVRLDMLPEDEEPYIYVDRPMGSERHEGIDVTGFMVVVGYHEDYFTQDFTSEVVQDAVDIVRMVGYSHHLPENTELLRGERLLGFLRMGEQRGATCYYLLENCFLPE